jgi:hypothetical protein
VSQFVRVVVKIVVNFKISIIGFQRKLEGGAMIDRPHPANKNMVLNIMFMINARLARPFSLSSNILRIEGSISASVAVQIPGSIIVAHERKI